MLSQVSVAQEFHYDQFTTDDGLPSNTIYEIVQDSTGLLWMGTENGLVSYDGVSFERFSDPRLKDNDILKLEISKDGHVTFSNISNQYCRLEGDKLKVLEVNFTNFFDIRSSGSADFIVELSGYKSMALYKYQDSLVSMNLKNFSALDFDSLNNISVFTFCETVDTTNWNFDGFFFCIPNYNSGRAHVFKTKINNQYYIWRESKIWQVDSTLFNNINLNTSTYLFKGKKKRFVTSLEGLFVYDPITYDFQSVLQNFEVNYGFIDKEENIWLGTVNDGLLKVVDSDFEILSSPAFSEDLRHVSMAEENIFSFSFSSLNIYNNELDLINSTSFEFEQDRHLLTVDSEIYVAGTRMIRKFDISGVETNRNEYALRKKAVSVIGSNIYIADRKSLFVVKKEIFSQDHGLDEIKIIGDLSGINVIVGLDFNDTVYVGTDDGLFQFDKFNLKPIVFSNSLNSKNIRSLFINEIKTLWIGTSNDGLYSLDENGRLDSIDIYDCIGSNVINDIVQYDNYLFLATSAGLARYDLNSQSCTPLNEYRGLLTNTIRKIMVKSLDSIFVTQNKELIMLNNSLFDKSSINPSLVLENTYVNNILQKSVTQEWVFNYKENNVEFQFDFYTYRNVGKKMIQYKFKEDSSWITSNDLNLRFPSLEPSLYSLEVRGLFSSTENTDTRTLEFVILVPWWETNWARIVGFLACGLIITFIVSTRNNGLRQDEAFKRESLKRLEASKREYLQQINKVKDQALQLQMNPHFIFNAMNAIQNFITSNRERDATIYLAKFAKLIRLIFEYSNVSIISMEAELEFVRLYIDLERIRFQNRVTCTLMVSESIEGEKDVLRVPPLLIQPVIENSFKHGLFHRLEGGELTISYDLVGDTIVTVIEDNGIGRDASRTMQNARSDGARHSGLKNIMQRLEIFRFNMPNQENSMMVEDLYIDGISSGTKTTIKVTIDENK